MISPKSVISKIFPPLLLCNLFLFIELVIITMSERKRSSSKITLGMLKGKSITTSVPQFAIRFHSGGEELDEFYPSAEDTDDDGEKASVNIGFEKDDSSAKNENPPSQAAAPSVAVTSDTAASASSSTLSAGSSSASATSAPSRDPSPMKEYFKGLGKRSTSMDAGIIDISSGSDVGWRIFHEWKGKITKTVEEKFSEKFSDKKPGSGQSSSAENSRRSRLGSGSGSGSKSKDNSSVSDEENSEPLNPPITETKIADDAKILVLDEKPPLINEPSPKKVMIEKKSLSLEEKDDVLSDSLTDPPSTSSAVDASDLTDISSKGLVKKSGFRSRMKHNISGLRVRHRAASAPITSGITMSSLSAAAAADDDLGLQTDSDIEPAVEASEETKFNTFQRTQQQFMDVLTTDDVNVLTTDYRTSVPTLHPPVEGPKKRIKFSSMFSRLWSSKFFVIGVILCIYSMFYTVPSSFMGFFLGALVMYVFYAIRDMINSLVMPKTDSQGDFRRLAINRDLSSSDLPILEVPAAKEYQPLTKYEGWMNEYPDIYNPETYSITATQSVYVRLEGSTLRVSNTRLKIPKRAMWNERKHKLRFTHQRIYNIANCSIKLLPEGLTRRRLWSKKYPICIILLKTSAVKSCVMNVVKETSLFDEIYLKSGVDSEGIDLLSQSSDTIPDSKSDFDESSLFDTKSGENKSFDEEEMSITGDISDEDTFCHIDKSSLEETCLYLFARTDREKEDWYRRLVAAVKFQTAPEEETVEEENTSSLVSEPSKSSGLLTKIVVGSSSPASATPQEVPEQTQNQPKNPEPAEDTIHPNDLDDENSEYLKFMSAYKLQVLTAKGISKLKPSPSPHPALHSSHRNSAKQKLEAVIQSEADSDVAPNLMWVNAFIGRALFDLMKNPFWVLKLQERIQKKLSAIRLPHFVGEILVSELEIGESVPVIHCTSPPMLDERGLWVNVDITYSGCASLTLETKLNLLKLKKDQPSDNSSAPSPILASPSTPVNIDKRSSPMFDSDLDDSAESSDDDSDFDKSSTEEEYVAPSNAGSTGKRILRMVNKIAASKYFQQATDYKYIKRAMEEVSNTRIILCVELKGLSGTLTLNFPPPPSDRLWYGFRGCPHLALSARPKFGERQVNISHVVSWIEKQLVKEFQKKFVLPNMDDIVIGPMKDALPK